MPATMFLKFDPEIKGNSSAKGYEGQIEVVNYGFGVAQHGGFSFAKGGTRVNANLEDMTVTFRMCSASPKLMQYCSSGKHLTKATLTCVMAGGDKLTKYNEIVLTDVIVSSYRTVADGSDFPHESISLNFAKVDQEFFATDNQGIATSAGKGSWNQQTGSSS